MEVSVATGSDSNQPHSPIRPGRERGKERAGEGEREREREREIGRGRERVDRD